MITFKLSRTAVVALLVFGSAVSAQEGTVRDSGKAPGEAAHEPKARDTPNGSSRAGESTAPGESKEEQPATPPAPSAVRRDPFRPYTTAARASPRRRENLTPLERYDLGQLKLVGIVWDIKEPNAMVEDSVGLGYIVKVGTPIGVNDGKVKAIRPGAIVIEETYVDIYGARKRRDVSMHLQVEKAQ